MGEIRSLRWSFLAELDRRYPGPDRLPPSPASPTSTPPTPPSSGSLPIPSASLPAGRRPLPPSTWTARELFIVGRRFKLLLPRPPSRRLYLSRTWIVTRQSELSCLFRDAGNPQNSPRHLPWERLEREVLRDRVRWHSSIPQHR